MSFSAEAKNELARILPEDKDCSLCELSALIKLSGSIQIVGYKKLNIKVITELNSIARKIFKLLKQNFDINTTISVNKNQMLKRNNSYVLVVKSEMGAEKLLRDLCILPKEEAFYPLNEVPKELLSISDPEKNYHMEFVTNNEEFSKSLRDLINSLGFNSKIVSRKNNYVVYLKESEQISDLLSIIGAHNALLSLQNTKIVKEMRNNVNRLVNCETANLSKTVNAAVRQVENIRLIQDTIGISSLPENLQEIARIREEYEDMTLKELGEMLNPPIGKSGVNHRLRKIEEIANKLRENTYK